MSEQKRSVLNRLRSIEGHIRGIERMVDEDTYCIDIIKQLLAVQGALDKVNAVLLENHLNTCVTTAIQSQDPRERQRVIGEILQIFQGSSNVGWNRNLQGPELSELLAAAASPGEPACHQKE